MTVGEFKDLVRRMRAKQQQFFVTRDRAVMRESIELERQVDELLAEKVLPGLPSRGLQEPGDLFGGFGGGSTKPGHAQ